MSEVRENHNCPYCLSPVGEHEERVRCPKCGVIHHADCWKTNGKCSVYGCDGWAAWSASITEKIAPHTEDHVELSVGELAGRPEARQQADASSPAVTRDRERMPCINCGKPVPPGKILCWDCRKSRFQIRMDNCTGPAVILLGGFIGIVALILRMVS